MRRYKNLRLAPPGEPVFSVPDASGEKSPVEERETYITIILK
jgi:hypothetical protein